MAAYRHRPTSCLLGFPTTSAVTARHLVVGPAAASAAALIELRSTFQG
jgi:hypothetical protein